MTRRKDQSAAGTAGFLGVPARRYTVSGEIPALAPPSWLERRVLRKLLALMGDPPVRFVLWNGEQVPAAGTAECRRLHIHDRRTLWQLVINPDLHFGDAYSRGTLDIEGDLTGFIECINRARRNADRQNPLFSALLSRRNRVHPNTLAGSRSNIHHHYNLGNEFFQLWLDEEMVYTCAYFPAMTLTLEQAQLAKLDYVCRKLRLQPGDTVIEAGCGWGALARYMARKYGVRVRAFNLSKEQIDYARTRAAAEGIGRNVEYIEDDYRNISGRCDVFVSIGMLEHVGRDNYRSLGEIIDRCLAPAGRGLIHSIGRDQPCHMNAWIERRVFPGSYPPTLREMMEIFEHRDFSVLDVENLRLHYAKTLEHWLARFEAHRDEVREHFDEDFVRAWRLYLAGSLAGFTTGWLQLFQVVFTRSGNNNIPWTREHLYANRS